MAVPVSSNYTGWFDDAENSRLEFYYRGTKVGDVTATRFRSILANAFVENTGLTDITTAGAETYTAAQLATGVITRDPNGLARTDTTATATAIVEGTPALDTDGDILKCYVINTADAAEAITLAGGTGVTISNVGQTIGQNESALLIFRRTSATAVTLYIVGA